MFPSSFPRQHVHVLRTINQLLVTRQRKSLQHAWYLFGSAVRQAAGQRKWQENSSIELKQMQSQMQQMKSQMQHLYTDINSHKAAAFSKVCMRRSNSHATKAFNAWQTTVKENFRVGTLIGRTLVRLCKRLRGRGIKPCSRLPTLVLSLSLESVVHHVSHNSLSHTNKYFAHKTMKSCMVET